MRRCLEPGCSILIPMGSRCSLHERLRRQQLHERRDGSGWAGQRRARAILDRDGHRCVKCGVPCPHPQHHIVDHIVRIIDGGSADDPANQQTLCKRDADAKFAAEQARGRRRPGAIG